MKSKFKIGEEIYFMNYNEPSKGIIKGIAFIVGEFEDSSSFKRNGSVENPSISYSVGAYRTIEESKAFSTKEELQADLFSKL